MIDFFGFDFVGILICILIYLLFDFLLLLHSCCWATSVSQDNVLAPYSFDFLISQHDCFWITAGHKDSKVVSFKV
jgi:hypothetical protein